MRELDVVGSNVDAFSCPRCGAHDRERHLLMYMQATGMLAGLEGKAVLHFAPEKRLSRKMEAIKMALYLRCDLYPTSPDVQRVDVHATEFESDSFDVLIANHVLEHVENDIRALMEIVRVLKAGGYAILQTPYSRKLHNTWEDAGISDADARLQAFGQADHVRLYGRDIFERFTSTGLVSRVRQHADLLSNVDPIVTGINESEPFFLFQRDA